MELRSQIFPELDNLYLSKNPFVRRLFWQRIETAILLAEINDDSTLLDIGCGSGHLIKRIREINSKCECWATDIHDSKITETVDCKFKVADVRSLPFEDGCFDIVFVLDVLEHLEDSMISAIKEIYRVLKPRGFVILSGPTESSFYKFCRTLLFHFARGSRKNQDSLITGKDDFHYRSVYQIEENFKLNGFSSSECESLPGFLFPPLFRVSRFQR